MNRAGFSWSRCTMHVLAVLVAVAVVYGAASASRHDSVAVPINDTVMRLSGPYTEDNLAIYLIHTPVPQDDRSFITLDEGQASKLVEVAEVNEGGTVEKLTIDNKSDQYLFLQTGDRVIGGKQDRIVRETLIVPPHSGKKQLDAFCVEQTRWKAGEQGIKFGNSSNVALAPKEVRAAAAYEMSQTAVWAEVANQRTVRAKNALANGEFKTSSLNEAMDDARAQRISDRAAAALDRIVARYPDAVGVVIAVNGQVEELNVYPNHALLRKQCPRLGDYGVRAWIGRNDSSEQPLSPQQVATFMQSQESDQRQLAALQSFGAGGQEGSLNMVIEAQNDSVQQLQQDVQRITVQLSGVIRDSSVRRGAARQVQARVQQQAQSAAPANIPRAIDTLNHVQIQQGATKSQSTTLFQGKPVHLQIMSRSQPSARAQPAPGQASPRQQPANQPAAQPAAPPQTTPQN